MKKIGKILAIIVVAFAVCAVFINSWLSWEGDSSEIVNAADSFQPPSSWRQTENIVYPPRNFCLTQICPSVIRSWRTDKIFVSKDEIISLLKKSNLQDVNLNDCFMKSDETGGLQYCRGLAHRNNKVYEVTYTNDLDFQILVRNK